MPCPSQTLCFITQITFSEQHKSCSPSVCSFHHPPVTSSLLGPLSSAAPSAYTLHTIWETQTKQHTTLQSCIFWTTPLLQITMLQLSIALTVTLHVCLNFWPLLQMPQFDFHCRAKPKRGVKGRLPTHLQVSCTYTLNTNTIQGVSRL